jgi:hypothetical protein
VFVIQKLPGWTFLPRPDGHDPYNSLENAWLFEPRRRELVKAARADGLDVMRACSLAPVMIPLPQRRPLAETLMEGL